MKNKKQTSGKKTTSRYFVLSVWLPLTTILVSGLITATVNAETTASGNRIIFKAGLITNSPEPEQPGAHQETASPGFLSATAITSTPQRAIYVNEQERHKDQINQLIIEEGIYSENLIDNYLSLADIFSKNNQTERALSAYESALQLIRIEHGLSTDIQLPVINNIANIQMLAGNTIEAYDQYNKLLEYQLAHTSDNNSALAYTLGFADNLLVLAEHAYHHETQSYETILELLEKSRSAYEISATYFSHNYKNKKDSLKHVSNQLIKTSYLIEKIYVEDLYRLPMTNTYQNKWDRNPGAAPPALSPTPRLSALINEVKDEMESDPLHSLHAVLDRTPPMIIGMGLLNSELQENVQQSEDTEVIFKSMINLADWALLTGSNFRKAAYTIYADAYDLVLEANAENSSTLINEYYSPELPVQIPTILPADFTLEAYGASENDARNVLGFIDISFRLNRYGHANHINVLQRSQGLDEMYEEILVQDIKRNQYRPMFKGSKPVRQDFSLRYYISELSQ